MCASAPRPPSLLPGAFFFFLLAAPLPPDVKGLDPFSTQLHFVATAGNVSAGFNCRGRAGTALVYVLDFYIMVSLTTCSFHAPPHLRDSLVQFIVECLEVTTAEGVGECVGYKTGLTGFLQYCGTIRVAIPEKLR